MELQAISKITGDMPAMNTATGSQQQEAPCYLLKLPGELRNEIYSLALYLPDGFAIDYQLDKRNHANVLALTMTCKQVRKECEDLFFELNEIQFEGNLLECLVGQDARRRTVESVERFCKKVIYGYHLESKLRQVHFDLGRCIINYAAPDTWDTVSNIVARLRGYSLRARLSFQTRDYIGPNIPYDCTMEGEKQTMIAMERCSKAATEGEQISAVDRQYHSRLWRGVGKVAAELEIRR